MLVMRIHNRQYFIEYSQERGEMASLGNTCHLYLVCAHILISRSGCTYSTASCIGLQCHTTFCKLAYRYVRVWLGTDTYANSKSRVVEFRLWSALLLEGVICIVDKSAFAGGKASDIGNSDSQLYLSMRGDNICVLILGKVPPYIL